jgi:hypothetical protein
VIERQAECREVGVLFVPQIRHGKVAEVVEIVDVAAGRDRRTVACGLRFFLDELARDVGDVVALVAVGRKLDRFALQLLRAGLSICTPASL